MSKYFDEIDPIKFEGRDSENPLALKQHNFCDIWSQKLKFEHISDGDARYQR